jgi:pyruvate/2-oxoglutarate dehydrogenase complex dihydrolipoamide acyltransferase (E2) component
VAGIGGTMALNLWKTTATKEPAKFTSGELAGQSNPADIRGSYTFGDIAAAFPVPVDALAQAFGVKEGDPAAFQCKQLETIYAGTEGGEIGTDSVRWFVALYAGLPYTPEDDSLLPAGALEVLAPRLSPERLAEVKAKTVGLAEASPAAATTTVQVPAQAPAAPAAPKAPSAPAPTTQAQAPAAPTAPASVAAAAPAAPAAAPAATTHTEETVVGEIKGKTTFGELTSWGVSKEAIEAALGMPMGKPGVSVRDYCIEKGVEFSTVRTALQTAVDAALGKR